MKYVQLATLLVLAVLVVAPCARPQDAAASRSGESESEREKVHSREMRMGTDQHYTIPEQLAKTKGDLEVSCTHYEIDFIVLPPQQAMENAACDSDLVVTGRMTSHVSRLTDDERFVYTDWSFVVDEVLMNTATPPVAHGGLITIAIPGGQLKLDGRTVTATCHLYRDTKFERDKEYFLFLRFLPGSGTYRVPVASGFALSGNNATGMADEFRSLPEWSSYDRDRVLRTARTAIGYAVSGCHKSKEQSNSAR